MTHNSIQNAAARSVDNVSNDARSMDNAPYDTQSADSVPHVIRESRFIGTSNHGFAQYAQEEIRRLFPSVKFINIVPTEVFIFDIPAGWNEAIRTIRGHEPIFMRHMQPVNHELESLQSPDDLELLKVLVKKQFPFHAGENVAVQVRKAENAVIPYPPSAVKAALDDVLTVEYGVKPVVREADYIISIYVTAAKLFAGCSKPEDNLSDWSGGAIRFKQEDDQISRAKFKLLEAEIKFGLDLSRFRAGLDIGAAPGGWTSLLLQRGMLVTAIDPALLDPILSNNPKLTYLRSNADDVKLRSNEFDLLVCDMSWNPRQMARLVSGLLYALRSGGTAIITVKLMHKKPFQTIRELMRHLSQQLEMMAAKQLFHNREEFTMLFKKK